MLQEMRKYAKSWVSSVFLGALALSFALWGIADIFRGNADTTVFSVGSTQIGSDLFAREYHNAIRNAGAALSSEQSRLAGQQVLERMVTTTALDNLANKLGLTATDARVRAQVQAMTVFHGPLGTFDRAIFVQTISRAGYSEDEFIAAIRKDSARDQMIHSIEGGYILPADYALAIFAFINEVRAAEYVVLTPSMLGALTPPSDDVLSAFVRAHPERFSTPEYRSVSYAFIGTDDVASTITVSDKQIQDEIDTNRADYIVPEKRDLEQMQFRSEAEAKAAKTALDAGKTFAALAAERNLKPAEYQIGTVVSADLDGPRATALFALPEYGVSAPVKGPFGWVLMRAAKIVPGSSKSRDEVRLALQRKLAAARLTDMANAFTDAVGGGASIEEAARKSGMRFGQIPSIDRQGLSADGNKVAAAQNPEFLAQIFKSDVGEEGDPFPTADGHFYALKVDGVTPPKVRSLDSVRAHARAQWIAEQQAAQLQIKAAALVATANTSHSLDDIAKSLGVVVQASPALTRGTDTAVFGKVLVESLFKARAGTTVFGPAAGGGYVIARVTGIAHAIPSQNDLEFVRGVRQLSGQVALDFTLSLSKAEQEREGTTINQKLVDSAVGNSGSGS
jgi:peptidyl-prolyl cis-trans isomerase D